MKCIITGATGHIGNTLTKKLCEAGNDVSAFVLPNEDTSCLKDTNAKLIYGDIRNESDVLKAFSGCDVVFHLAGIIAIDSGQKRIMDDVNINGVKNVISACSKLHIKRLVYTSSVHAIAEPKFDVPISETDCFSKGMVKGEYAKSKAEATRLILEAAKDGLNVVVVHPAGVIGPNDYKLSNIGQMMNDFVNGELPAYIDGKYNFVDVRDVADAIISANIKGKSGECYILSGEMISVKDMFSYLEEVTGAPAPKRKIPCFLAILAAPFFAIHYKLHHRKPVFTAYSVQTLQTNCNFCNAKAKNDLDFRPRSVKVSLKDAVLWLTHHQKKVLSH
ncbi:MAG: NAD-dependent epimerase/dehydratase family protein [Christensenellaceae bacterium]